MTSMDLRRKPSMILVRSATASVNWDSVLADGVEPILRLLAHTTNTTGISVRNVEPEWT